MRKKASKSVQLVLITSVLASCSQSTPQKKDEDLQKVYMRADTTAPYTEVTENYHANSSHSGHGGGMGSSFLWYMAFRNMGGGLWYANNNLRPESVVGNNAAKASAFKAQRGGFGKSARSSHRSSFGS